MENSLANWGTFYKAKKDSRLGFSGFQLFQHCYASQIGMEIIIG